VPIFLIGGGDGNECQANLAGATHHDTHAGTIRRRSSNKGRNPTQLCKNLVIANLRLTVHVHLLVSFAVHLNINHHRWKHPRNGRRGQHHFTEEIECGGIAARSDGTDVPHCGLACVQVRRADEEQTPRRVGARTSRNTSAFPLHVLSGGRVESNGKTS
jgi:hypothetical protein